LSLVVAMVLARLDYGSATLAGRPDLLLSELQSVLNAAARLVFSGHKYDQVTPLLRDLHWLPFPERITFRLAVLAYRCQHGLAPSYLSADLHRVADADFCRRLRSPSTAALLVPRTRLSTVGDRAFPVAAARVWNNLPPQCHFSVLSVYFQKETQNRTVFSPFLALIVYIRTHVLFYMSLIYVYFLFKRPCSPPVSWPCSKIWLMSR